MGQVDTVIRNGKVVRPDGIFEAGIAIRDGRIVAMAKDPDDLPPARRVVDAYGLHVFPGVLDPHIHLQTFTNRFDENIRTETKTAAVGGVTTIIPTLLNREDATLSFLEHFPWCRDAVEHKAVVDAAFSAVIGTDQQIKELPQMAHELGICSFKFYMAYTGDEAAVFGIKAVDDGQLLDGFRMARDIGQPCIAMVHAENMSIVHNLKGKLIAEGRNDLKAWTDARPDIAEEECTRRAIFYAQRLGAPLYIVHMTIGLGVQWVAEARAQGVNVIAETCPHYLTYTKYDQDTIGHLAKVNPPLRDKWNQDKLWAGLASGTISCLGSDHSTIMPRGDKLQRDIWTCVPGFPATGTMLPIMISEGYHKGRISLERLAEVMCYNNARIFGLFPRKGDIRVGADADLVLLDLEKKQKVTPETMKSFADWTLYDDWELKGWPVATMVRGEYVMQDGEIVVPDGYGTYIARYPVEERAIKPLPVGSWVPA